MQIFLQPSDPTAVGKQLLPGWFANCPPPLFLSSASFLAASCCQSLNQNVTWRGSFAWRLLENWNRNVRISALIIRRYVLRTSQVSWLLVCPHFFFQWIFLGVFCFVLFYSLRFGFHPSAAVSRYPYLCICIYVYLYLYLCLCCKRDYALMHSR